MQQNPLVLEYGYNNPGGYDFPCQVGLDRGGKECRLIVKFLWRSGLTIYGYPETGDLGKAAEAALTYNEELRVWENGVFRLRGERDLDCTCGFHAARAAWEEAHPHAETCYQTRLQRRETEIARSWAGPEVTDIYEIADHEVRELARSELDEFMRGLCRTLGKSEELGSMVHCTCTREAEEEAYVLTHGHQPDCQFVQPNFLHKSSGLKLWWYKYAMRSPRADRQLVLTDLRPVLIECLESMHGPGSYRKLMCQKKRKRR